MEIVEVAPVNCAVLVFVTALLLHSILVGNKLPQFPLDEKIVSSRLHLNASASEDALFAPICYAAVSLIY